MDRATIPPMLGDVIDAMHDGLYLVDPRGRIVMANQAFLGLTGYTREEVEGRPCTILGCDECVQHLDPGDGHWCRLFSTEQPIRQQCHIMSKDGRFLPVIKATRVLRDDAGQVIAAVENVTDIKNFLQNKRRIDQLEHELWATEDFCGMVGQSSVMQRLFRLIEKAANSDAAAIVYGESGVGKELVAHAIHYLGPRHEKPFVQINCAAFNESLLESELFGHVKGAFTGAHRHRVGRFEEVQDGDIFLDEVGDVPLPTQVKMLRVLDNRVFERVGDNQPLPMNARIISATNQDLVRLCEQRRFRRDFYYRINVVPLHVPPLRERREDIPLLVDHFVRRFRKHSERDVPGLTPEAMAKIMEYDWPGNVRELRSALEYAFVVCTEGHIGTKHLPRLKSGGRDLGLPPPNTAFAPRNATLTAAEQIQRDELVSALRDTRGNKSAAARNLGVSRLTILNRMRKYGIDLQRILLS